MYNFVRIKKNKKLTRLEFYALIILKYGQYIKKTQFNKFKIKMYSSDLLITCFWFNELIYKLAMSLIREFQCFIQLICLLKLQRIKKTAVN